MQIWLSALSSGSTRPRGTGSSPRTAGARTFSSTTAPSRAPATRSSPRASGSSSTPSRAPRARKPRACVLPRPGSDRFDRSDRGDRSDRPAGRPGRTNTDSEALTLREKGHSYAAVARNLGLKRAVDARAAFLRALRSRPESDRTQIVVREHERLDALEARIRD